VREASSSHQLGVECYFGVEESTVRSTPLTLIVMAMAISRLDRCSIGCASWRRGPVVSRQLMNGIQHEIPKISRIVLALVRKGNNSFGNDLNCRTIAVS
jgi:hypothetical protein